MRQTEKKESDESGPKPKKELRVDKETIKDLSAKQGEQVKGGVVPTRYTIGDPACD